MKGLIFSSLAGVFIASIGISYADSIRITGSANMEYRNI